MLSVAIMTVGMIFIESIGFLYLGVAITFLFIAMVILISKVNETKGADFTTVTGSEWDLEYTARKMPFIAY